MINNQNKIFDQSLLLDLLNATADLIMLVNVNGAIEFSNNFACKFFGLSHEEMPLENLYDYLSDTEMNFIKKILQTGRPQFFEHRKNNKKYFCDYLPVINDLNRMSQIAILMRDITEISRLDNNITGVLKNNGMCTSKRYDDLEQHLVGMSYLLTLLKKKNKNSSSVNKSLVSQLVQLNKEAIQKLKEYHAVSSKIIY